jgi:hypothetical protein
MKKTIFNVYVAMTSQAQCNRMKAVCLENGLPIWDEFIGWIYSDIRNKFGFVGGGQFHIYKTNYNDKTQVTEAEFLELLKEYKDGIQNN